MGTRPPIPTKNCPSSLQDGGRSFAANSSLSAAPPAPSWGSMIGEGRHFLFIAPHLVTAPGAAILLTVMAFNFLGDGLRDALDVRAETG